MAWMSPDAWAFGRGSHLKQSGGSRVTTKPTPQITADAKKAATEVRQTADFTSKPATDLPVVPVAAQSADVLGSTPPDSLPPESRYVTGRLHAEGGIGRVWLARDTQLNREVALKTLRPELLSHRRARSRFLKEAEITGQLEHPGVVPVYELITHPQSGQPFYAMRFVHGCTLVQAARDYHDKRQSGEAEPLGLVALLNAFVAVCNTVAYAHSRGVIHRDLKGENVLLGDFGEVIVLDWGVAKVLGSSDEEGGVQLGQPWMEAGVDQTMEGDIVGTPAYMAPEQADGRLDLIDARTDIYGLGAILYEILTGRPPFTGSNTVEVLDKVLRDDPVPPRQLWPDVPPTLDAACLKALSKEPCSRYAAASALGEEIQTWQEVQRRQAEEEMRRSRERFELAVRGSQDGLWDWDLRTDEVFYSARWKSILGYEDHEIAHRLDEWEKRLHPEERERVLAANYAHITGTTSHYEYEYRLRHKDGSYRWILARGVALRDASGKAYRMAGSHVDITAWKEMERALQESEQRYRAVVESAPCGILVVSADGSIRDCNREAERILGAPAEQLVHRPITEFCKRAFHQDGSAVSQNELQAWMNSHTAIASGERVVGFRGEDGSLNWVSVTPCPVGPSAMAWSGRVVFLHSVAGDRLPVERISSRPGTSSTCP
jgi:PAS domain S-box-containing protein